jgi:K(+)-stimulated pyrophosphate-energized sodium pump
MELTSMTDMVAIFGASLFGFGVVGYMLRSISSIPVKHEKAAQIAAAIRAGAMTFLREEYQIISLVVLLIMGVIWKVVGILPAACFLGGSVSSMLTGFIGMWAATGANVRTALAAKDKGEHAAFQMAFFGGGVMGFAVASFGLFCLGALFHLYSDHQNFVLLITCFGLGASLVAFFARIGGGIFTKAADVGADLVGKLEAGIPEDDPRNPAVIADNVGDCVGDTAGMGADIYESYVGAMVGAIILAAGSVAYSNPIYVKLPLMLAVFGLVGSVAGLLANFVLRLEPAAMLRNASYIAIAVFLGLSYYYLTTNGMDMVLFTSIFLGCFSGIVIGLITEYYTGNGPVERLADISRSGAATNIIYGLSIGMESTALPVIILSGVVLASFTFGGGTFGVSIAAVAMLATVGISMTVDAYGPIADNAGGIAEMSGLDPAVRKITDKLDALGNTTAAIGKGFAIGSALLASLALFTAYAEAAHIEVLNILDPIVIVGVFLGGVMPFLVSALTMRSVGTAALQMVMEVRRQFKEIPGIMAGTTLPDYKQCVAISTKASLREMMLPGLLTVLVPVAVKFSFAYFFTKAAGALALGGLLVGATVTGVLLALMMANGGGAWDNAKKYIEAGNCGGRGSEAHRAAITGDTVGDPFKDTSGPSLNILIKLMSVVALLLALI